MTTLDAASVVLSILVTGGGVALIVLAAVVFVGSRRAGTARVFGVAVHRPRLSASVAVCGGVAGLLFVVRELMPSSWQKPSLNILGVLQLAFVVLLVTHIFSQLRTKRRHGR